MITLVESWTFWRRMTSSCGVELFIPEDGIRNSYFWQILRNFVGLTVEINKLANIKHQTK